MHFVYEYSLLRKIHESIKTIKVREIFQSLQVYSFDDIPKSSGGFSNF